MTTGQQRDKYTFMEEEWGIDGNPFPSEAIEATNGPYCDHLFPEEKSSFISHLVYSAVMDRRPMGFLWSKGPGGRDTGFGKTTMMRNVASQINEDWGKRILEGAGMRPEKVAEHKLIAMYAAMNTLSVAGIYPLLFSAVEYAADPRYGVDNKCLIERCRDLILVEAGVDPSDPNANDFIEGAMLNARQTLGPTLPPMRSDFLDAFVAGEPITDVLAEVSPASRVRNGLAYFDVLFTIAYAAGIHDVFVSIDQLEDLATRRDIGNAKKQREVGRFRDILSETLHYKGRLHAIFTFHIRAQQQLGWMWRQERLPSFDPDDPANQGSVVVLRGLRTVDQVRDLLVTYLDTRRVNRADVGIIRPFEPSALDILLQRSEGRVGILLQDAYRILDSAALQGHSRVDGGYIQDLFGGRAEPAAQQDTTTTESQTDIVDRLLQ